MTLLKASKAGSLILEPDGSVDMDKVRKSEWWANRQAKAMPKAEQPPLAKPVSEQPARTPAEIAEKREKIKRLLKIESPELLNTDKINLEKLLLLERREALRLENEERRGRLWNGEEAQQAFDALVSATRSHLLLLPGKLAHRLAAVSDIAECQAIIDREIKEAMRSLCEHRLHAA